MCVGEPKTIQHLLTVMLTQGPHQQRRDPIRQHSTAESTTSTITNNKMDENIFVGIDPIMAPATYALEMQQQQKSVLLCRKKSKEDLNRDGDCDSDSSCGESSKRRRITSRNGILDEKNFMFRHNDTTSSSRSTCVSATATTASSTTAPSSSSYSYSSTLSSSAARRHPFDMTELIRVSTQQHLAATDSSLSSERHVLPFPPIEWNVSDDDDGDRDDTEKERKGGDFSNNENEEYSTQYISSSRSSLCEAQHPKDSFTSRRRQDDTKSAASQTHAFLDRLFASRSASAPDFTSLSLLSMTIDDDFNLAGRHEASLKILLGGGGGGRAPTSSSSSLNALHPSRLVGSFSSAPSFPTIRTTQTNRNKKHATSTIPSVSAVSGNRFPHLVRSIVWDSHLSLLAEDFDDNSRHENDHNLHRLRRPRPTDDFVLLPETSYSWTDK